jgi:colanic acid/amylovoran biosynthesis glycosyltransferase
MRVTFCAYDDYGYFCGPNAWLRRLLPDLKKQGVDVGVLFIAHSDPELCPTIVALQNRGIPCKAVSGLEFTKQRVKWILKSLREDPPDVFVPNLMVAAFYAAKWVKEYGVPTVGVMHSDDDFYYALLNEFVCGRPDYRLSALVCVSDYLEHQALLWKSNATIIRRIPYGVPITETYCHWSDGPLRLVYTGRLKEQQKRITEVTRALCKAVRKVPGTEAYVYGDGPERTNVENILLHEGKNLPVFLKGLVDSDLIQENLLEGHIFVLLSDYEGLPISLMEAMACGLVPVCLKISSGIPELINDSTNGLLVNDRNDSFVNAVRKLREDRDLWERLSSAACATIKDGYDRGSCVESWMRLFEEVKSLRHVRGNIRVPWRIELPPVNPGLAREDNRTLRGLALVKNRVKCMLGFAKRAFKSCMPKNNRF